MWDSKHESKSTTSVPANLRLVPPSQILSKNPESGSEKELTNPVLIKL